MTIHPQHIAMKKTPLLHLNNILLLVEFLFLFIFINFALLFLLRDSLPHFIEQNNDTPYVFEYDEIHYSFFQNKIELEGIRIYPKKERLADVTLDFEAEVDFLEISGVSFFQLLRWNNLYAKKIAIVQPKVVYYQTVQDEKPSEASSALTTSLRISLFQLKGANFEMYGEDKQTLLGKIENLDVAIDGVNLSQKTLAKGLPFSFKGFEMTCDAFLYVSTTGQMIRSKGMLVSDEEFHLNGFEITSVQDTLVANHPIDKKELIPEIAAPKVVFSHLDWGFEGDDFYFLANTLKFDSLSVHLPHKKEAVEEEIEEQFSLFPFQMKIDKIVFSHAQFEKENAIKIADIELVVENLSREKNQALLMDKISVSGAEITQFSKKSSTKNKTAKSSFHDSILVNQLTVNGANYSLRNLSTDREELRVRDWNAAWVDMRLDGTTLSQPIPFEYRDFTFSYAQLDYHPNAVYHLSTQKMSFEKGDFVVHDFRMKPKLSRSQFVKSLKKEQDLYVLSADRIRFEMVDWGFVDGDFSLSVPKVLLEKVNADIYRSKIPADDFSKKLMYGQLLRELPFHLKVDELNLKDATLVYEEETEKSEGAGKLLFSNFNAQIKHINSGFKKTRLPKVEINIQTDLMNDARLNAFWTFDPMNRNEQFRIKGSIHDFDAKKMNPFIQPYLHATVEGDIREIRFDFVGNDWQAQGNFGMQYDDLKIALYHSKTGKKRKLLTAIGNLALKNSTGDDFKQTSIKTVERQQDRSFFNFFWLCVQQGLKQTVLVI